MRTLKFTAYALITNRMLSSIGVDANIVVFIVIILSAVNHPLILKI